MVGECGPRGADLDHRHQHTTDRSAAPGFRARKPQSPAANRSQARAIGISLKLYKLAGISGGSSHSGRHTFAGKVLAATGDFEKVALLLGHSSIDISQRYIDVRESELRRMFADAV